MQWRIGDVTVTKVVELEVTGGSRFILPQATYEAVLPIGWLQPHFADENGRNAECREGFVEEEVTGQQQPERDAANAERRGCFRFGNGGHAGILI